MSKAGMLNALKLNAIALAINQIFIFNAQAMTDAERIADLEKRLEQSINQIQQLSDRVNQLESTRSPHTAATSSATTSATPAHATPSASTATLQQKVDEQNERIALIEKNVTQVAESSLNQSPDAFNLFGVPVHGFAAINYTKKPNRPELPDTLNNKSGFQMTNVDFYLTPNFGDRLKALFELNFEYTEQGMLAIDLERFEFGYTFSDALTVWAGRFHTPFGYYNTAFHHGNYIETTTGRPRFVEFEDQGGILPSHTVGLTATGFVKANEDDKVKYDVFIGNGSRIIPASDGNNLGIPLGNQLDFNPVGDDNRNVAVGGRVGYEFNNELLVGVHGLTEHIDTYDGDNVRQNSTRLAFYGGYYYFEKDNWESIGEYYRFRNKDLSGNTGTHSSWAAFAQLSYTFGNIWTPYIRFEKAVLDQTDNYFASLESGRSYDRQVLGVRYDFNKSAALKFEFHRTNEQEVDLSEDTQNEYILQYAVKF